MSIRNRDLTVAVDGDKIDWSAKREESFSSEVVLNKLKQISKKYEDDLNRRAKEYAESTLSESFDSDEDILAAAQASLDGKYAEKRAKSEQKHKDEVEDLEEKRTDYGATRDQNRERLKESFRSAWEDKKDDLSRKGLSHSSIADLSAREMRSAYRAASQEEDARYDRRVRSLDRKIERLNAEYREALQGYEISYAIELEKKVAALTAKRDRLIDSYEKTHESEVKKAYNSYIREEECAQREYESAYGDYFGEKKENYVERYDYMVDALKGKKKSAVENFIKANESELRNYLGAYYDAFVKEVN